MVTLFEPRSVAWGVHLDANEYSMLVSVVLAASSLSLLFFGGKIFLKRSVYGEQEHKEVAPQVVSVIQAICATLDTQNIKIQFLIGPAVIFEAYTPAVLILWRLCALRQLARARLV